MNYTDLMQKPGKRINPKVYYFNDSEKIEYGYDSIISSKPFFNAKLVGTVMRGLELELKQELPNTAIYFENEVIYGSNSATKLFGPYFLQEKATLNADSKTYSHKLYDNFVKTMVPYKPINISYPTTVFEFFKQLTIERGFKTDITSLPNGNRVIDYDLYADSDFTDRDVYEDIGQATGTLFKMDNDVIKKCSLTSDDEITIDDDILKNENINLGEHFGPINSIILSRSGDSDFIYKRDETLTEWNEYKISDNQLMNDNNRSDYLNELYEALYGIEYDIFDLELVGFGGFEPLQKIKIITNNQEYYSYVFNNEQEYNQGYSEAIYTELPEETNPDYTVSDTTDKRIKQTYIIVNKQSQQITALAESVGENESTINQLEIDLDGISQQVQNFTDQSETIAKIETTVEEIKQSIGSITDTTVTSNGVGTISLDNVLSSEILELKIYPTSEDLSYRYFWNEEFLGDDVFTYNRDLVFIPKEKEEKEVRFTLPCDLLYISEEVRDELIVNYDSQEMYAIKRVGLDESGHKYALEQPTTQYFVYNGGIVVPDGDYNVKMDSFDTAYIYVRALAKNIYTSQYATKVELNSSIELTKQSITSSVDEKINLVNGDISELDSKFTQTVDTFNFSLSQKLNSNEFTKANIILAINNNTSNAKINADVIDLKANNILNLLAGNTINLTSSNITISSNNFSVDAFGNTTLNSAEIKNGNITFDNSSSKISILGSSQQMTLSVGKLSMSATYAGWSWDSTLDASGLILNYKASTTGKVTYSNQIVMEEGSDITRISAKAVNSPVIVQTSLESQKKNFEKLNDALSIIDDIDIYKYNLKSEKNTDKKHIGFVIGDNYKYSSEITAVDENGKEIGVDTYSMASLCLQAIKELYQLWKERDNE